MRLIDADRLLSDAMKTKYYHLPNGDVAIPLIDIEHAPTVGEWISVKDRLPEQSGQVLVCIGEFQNMTTLEYSIKHRAFNAFDDLPDAVNTIDNVTHWMPLPEPPKEVKPE